MEESQQTPQTGGTPKVSAVIFSYNHAAALRRCIEALDKSAVPGDLEILVVDSGSDDESPTLDAQFPDAKFLRLERHFGATKALNIGTRTALGEYIFFLEPEVEVEPATVAALAARLDADTDALAVCPLLINEENRPVSVIRRLPDANAFKACLKGESLPSTAIGESDESKDAIDVDYPDRRALLVRKSFLRNMNYLDARFGHHWSDADLCAQIRRAGKRIRLLPGVRVRLASRAPDSKDARLAMTVDLGVGAAEYLDKYNGFAAGLGFRTWAIFWALGKLFTFNEPGFALGRLAGIVSGQKIDGSQ